MGATHREATKPSGASAEGAGVGVHSVYSVYSVVHINHELHIRGSSDAQRADTKLWSFILHQLFKQHNRLQSASQVGGSSHPCPMRKNLSDLPFKRFQISDARQRQFCRGLASHKPFDSIHSYAYRSFVSAQTSIN